MEMKIETVALEIPAGANLVAGQAHFIKTVEDLAEIVAGSVPGTLGGGAKFGLAFNEASGPCLVRTEGNDPALVEAAARCALATGAGHTFYLLLGNVFPINVLDRIKACPEVCRIFCATANPVSAIVARSGNGAGILGVIDGASPAGVEDETAKADRKAMLRRFGYKFG